MKRKLAFPGLFALFTLAVAVSAASPGAQAAVSLSSTGGITTITYENVRFTAQEGGFLSAPIEAPFPFNAVVPGWEADEEIAFEMRSGAAATLGEWIAIAHNDDLGGEEAGREVGDMLLVPAVDKTHTWVQLRVPSQTEPLTRLHLTFIDTSEGPTTTELLARQAELDAQNGTADVAETLANPKPAYISRGVWCTYAECSYNSCMPSDPLKYADVTHLIVHHTVTNNSGSDWAATVRAIFRYHALSSGNCWGDIGYNYLIDMNGVIYEGHRGGDNVIGTHAAGGNKGSMGVSLIGTFTWPQEYAGGIRPPDKMLNSLINILAWKADQRQINVYEGGQLPDLSGGRPKLMGHRDVYGTTTCPGGQAHALLPWARDQVAARLPWLVNDHVYIDELSNQFFKSASNWREPTYQCGYNTHSFYTWSTSNQNASPYWGEWRFNVPANGLYEVEVFVPYCNTGTGETKSAKYTVYHTNGSSQKTVNQQDRVGLWTSLGSYQLAVASDNRLRLTDITNDNGLGVWFDTIRVRRLQYYGRVDLRQPAADAWVTASSVTFQWDVVDVINPTSMRLRVATDAGMTNIIRDDTFGGGTRESTLSLPTGTPTLYWQVTAEGLTQANSAVGKFIIDTVPPSAILAKVYKLPWGSYLLDIDADDGESGLASISAQYRAVGASVWVEIGSGVPGSSISFYPPNGSQNYEFRVSARDQAGNSKSYSATAEGTTAGATVLTRTLYLGLAGR